MSKERLSLLIIEDDPSQRAAVQVRLKRKIIGDVDTAENGYAGLEILKKKSYGLILIDLGLPDINGEDVVKIYRKNNPKNTTPIVALTGQVLDDTEQQNLIKSGFNGYLKKPLKWDLLKIIIEKLGCSHLCLDSIGENSSSKRPRAM